MSSLKTMKERLTLAYLMAVCALLPCPSHAQNIEGIINRTARYLQGGIAKALGFLCIVVGGYLCLHQQRFPKSYFIIMLIGLGIIFGASTIYNYCVGG